MYKAFRIKENELSEFLSNNLVSLPKSRRNEITEVDKKVVFNMLSTGKIDVEKVKKIFFPQMSGCDIFLSHYHEYNGPSICLKNFLEYEIKLSVFVDSELWANVYDLLKIFDDEYSSTGEHGKYNYEKRNETTANLYMILISSLMEMISSSKFFLFVDHCDKTENKISVSSPWIYLELLCANYFQKSRQSSFNGSESFSLNESLVFDYLAPSTKLKEITCSTLNSLVTKDYLNNYHFINNLYKL
ncbi:MAG: hypothetical protein IJ254_07715 [Succinivibrio sp.]|nr:hypothetical protein [Succinivibrio sp.]